MSSVFRLALCLAAFISSASAQLAVSVALDKGRNNFVTHESIVARVTVQNRAGKTILLGGPNNQTWLQFNLVRPDGSIVASKNGEPKAEPTMLKEDGTLTKSINLTNFYPVDEPGSYMLTCSVYFPELGKWLGSAGKSLITVNSPKAAFWEQVVGLPKTHPQAGHYRRYKLFTNKSNALTTVGNSDLELLYVKITDEETEGNVTTYAVAPILKYRDPQPTLDKEGNLCVLFMASPQLFQYVCISPDGAIKDQKQYRTTDVTPQLMQAKDGYVSVRGGQLVDRIKDEEEASLPQNQVRGMGDRPGSAPR